MDRKSIFAMVLISIIILLLPFYQQIINGDKESADTYKNANDIDTVKTDQFHNKKEELSKKVEDVIRREETFPIKNELKNLIKDKSESNINIVTDNIDMIISNRGGGSFKKFELKRFTKYNSSLVNIIDPNTNNGLELFFNTVEGNPSNLNNIYFLTQKYPEKIFLKDDDFFKISYSVIINTDTLKKTFVIYGNKYHIDIIIEFSNPENTLLNREYQIGWSNGIPSTESYISDDYTYNQAYAYMGDELENFDISDAKKVENQNISGTASWIAIRTKYFITSLSNINADVKDGIYFSGEGIKKEDYIKKIYNIGYNIKYSNSNGGDSLRLYIGPLDHKILKTYDNNLDILIMNNGWYERTFRFITILVLPILEFIYSFIPNYGIVIIIFSLLVKILLHPLTKKSYSSMKEMQKLQPVIADLNEKYKNDPQKKNKELMKIYKEHGVNPLGGCLPTLLQLPFLFALFIVFRSTIQLRGASFIHGWVNDLSRTDTLFLLPFSLPWYGNEFNLLPILMTITMLIQSKMTMQDPKQKAMIYIMPIFMLLIFNKFPSGLNLYYTMFNIWSILQQYFITDRINKKVNK